MNKEEGTKPHLVITAALRKEIPLDWFRSHGVSVHTLNALRAGGLDHISDSDRGILVIITGVGMEESKEAARWIRDNLSPLFVLNIGTCGVTDKRRSLGRWYQPDTVEDEAGKSIELDTRLPIPYPDKIESAGPLLSVRQAVTGNLPAKFKKHSILDMECFAQAEMFSRTDITFHCLKFGTDYSDSNTLRDFHKNIEAFRESVKKLFAFLHTGSASTAISAIIPVYNRESSVRRAIDSILSQSCPPSEVIVVDDCSHDGTRQALEEYGDAITRIYLENNSGPSRARNEGARCASAEWLAFLDSDDCWEKDKLKGQIEYLRKYPFYEIVQSEEKWIRNGIRVNPHKHHKKPLGWIWEPSLERCLVSPSGVLLKKSLFMKFQGFNEDLPVCEDYDLWLRISRHHPAGLDPRLTVIKYGGHDDQLSRRFPVMDRYRVTSLAALLERESHPYFRRKIIHVLRKKLMILIKGSEKREKQRESLKWRDMMNAVEHTGMDDRSPDNI